MRDSPVRSASSAGPRAAPSALTLAASITVFTGLAITQPVLDVLGSNPEFFVARASPRADAAAAGIVLGVALPVVLAGAVLLVVRLHRRAGLVLHAVVLAALSGAFGFRLAADATVGGIVGLGAGVVGGMFVVGVLHRMPDARAVFRWSAPVPLLSLALFAFVSPASRLLFATENPGAIETGSAAPIPVTVVVFDELPTASLLRAREEIDRARFPNFAAFADDAVWYRNATTVSDRTNDAVPAVLTGRRPGGATLPIAADHPVSLFTLLGASHRVHATEPVTDLCPPRICDTGTGTQPGTPAGAGALASDVAVVAGHLLLPPPLRDGLPAIDRTWGNFVRTDGGATGRADTSGFSLVARMNAAVEADRRGAFRGVVRAEPGGMTDRPPAYILHTMLPHVPYRFLPSGQLVLPSPLTAPDEDDLWEDAWLAEHVRAQHLLQVGYADRVLGDLLGDLRAAGLYDRGLVVVTSDHGVSFEVGTHRRRVVEESLAQIAAVPLLVKYPEGPRGVVDPRPAETVDIVPTVLDVLGVETPQGIVGHSLRQPAAGEGTSDGRRTIDGLIAPLTFTAGAADPWEVARTQRRDAGDAWSGVYRHGPRAGLVGADVEDLATEPARGLIASVDHLDHITEATPASDPIPGVVTGGVGFAEPREDDLFLAIAFDGEIVSIGRTYGHEGTRAPFVSLVPPAAYEGGVDEVSVYAVREGDAREVLVGPLGVP